MTGKRDQAYSVVVFTHQGPARSETKNALLAAYLAFAGGYANSAGFVLLGTFTSHVTGNVGRLAIDVAHHDIGGTLSMLVMVFGFFSGAVIASIVIESSVFPSRPYAYGAALSVETALLLALISFPESVPDASRAQALEATVLCTAMGLQNSLVTQLSGAVIRTTHLTGVMTDLGIEVARWVRWGRFSLARRFRTTAAVSHVDRPQIAKIRLLAVITTTFSAGALSGAFATLHLRHRALALPIVGLATSAAYAFATGRARISAVSGSEARE